MRYPQHHLSGTVGALAGIFAVLSAVPVAAAQPPIPSHCRDFSEMVKIDGARQPVHGMVCHRSDGSWQVVPPPLKKTPLNTPYAPVTTELAQALPAGASNAAAYFWSPTDLSFPQYCTGQAPAGGELGWPGFYPSGAIVHRSLFFTTNVFGFPIGPTVVAIAPPSVAVVNPHGGGHH